MVKVWKCSVEHDRYTDPDSYLGPEERVYFNHELYSGGLPTMLIAKAIDACNGAGIRDAYLCFRVPHQYRQTIFVSEPASKISEQLSKFSGEAMFHMLTDVKVYIATRGSFDEEKLLLMLMKAPANAFI